MPDNPEENHRAWWNKAEEDALSLGAVLRDGAPSTACFLAQQVAEKYLKGLLVFYRKHFSKVHDLLHLETLLLDIVPDVGEIHQDLDELNRYYVETRYPGDYPVFTADDSRRASEAAQRIKEFALSKVRSAQK